MWGREGTNLGANSWSSGAMAIPKNGGAGQPSVSPEDAFKNISRFAETFSDLPR